MGGRGWVDAVVEGRGAGGESIPGLVDEIGVGVWRV